MRIIPRTFVIRPFGLKSGIDFEAVHADLIGEALARFGVQKTTTLDILSSGNIRTDMFSLLVTADLVVADLSLHNANVFYELGIRHALRKRRTILIRAKGGDPIPFDLFTDRYLAYDGADPKASLEALARTIEATLDSEVVDSPVFNLVSKLPEPVAETFLIVPPDFKTEVDAVCESDLDADTKIGDLALLGNEVDGLPWEIGGLRHVGRAQFGLKALEPAAETWERIRTAEPYDVEANQRLSTIYQRLDDLAQSDAAIARVLALSDVTPAARSETLALRGRNAKARWTAEWKSAPTVEERQRRALTSSFLAEAHEAYYEGYAVNLMNHYPGINALATALLITGLAARQPEVWDTFEEAETERSKYKRRLGQLRGAVAMAIEIDGGTDVWSDVSRADLAFYDAAPAATVRARYARIAGRINSFQVGAVRDQLELFRALDLHVEQTEAALSVLPQAQAAPEPPHVILFTGHRIDDPGRPKPRFPQSLEDAARAAIERALDAAAAKHGTNLLGISGAASGGDILFLEACERRGIPVKIYLALPPDLYVARSVAPSKGDWTDRFYGLTGRHEPRILQPSEALPPWLVAKKDTYKVWERCNLWMFERATVHGGAHMTLLVLWNGESGDGPGGTADMVSRGTAHGARVVRLLEEELRAVR